MKRAISFLFLVVAVTCSGCVGTGTYQKRAAEAETLGIALDDVRGKYADSERTLAALKSELAGSRQQVTELKETSARLERLIEAKDDVSWQRLAQLEREKSRATEQLADVLRDREGKTHSARSVYERILEAMTEEIAAGRVTVSELRGIVRVAVLNSALFADGSSDLTPTGGQFLTKLASVVAGLPVSRLTVQATVPTALGGLAGTGLPTLWSLPTARAEAVIESFQRQGGRSLRLVTLVRGERGEAGVAGGLFSAERFSRIDLLLEVEE